jgi:hypothetical protein
MSWRFTHSLVRAELGRFRRSGLLLSVLIPLGVGLLIQIAVPDTVIRGGLGFEKRAFYCVIFSFWLGITNSVRRIVAERRTVDRLRIGGASAGAVLLSKSVVVVVAACIHAVCFYGMFTVNVADLSEGSWTSSRINGLRYGRQRLTDWFNRESAWHAANEDPFSESRDAAYDSKVSLGTRYEESRRSHQGWLQRSDRRLFREESSWPRHPGILCALFLASVSAGVMGLALSAAFRHGRAEAALLCVPFITAFQIVYAKVTTDGGSALFGALGDLPTVFEWYSLYHVLSLLTVSRYLVVISLSESWQAALLSLDATMVYVCIVAASGVTLLLLRRVKTP